MNALQTSGRTLAIVAGLILTQGLVAGEKVSETRAMAADGTVRVENTAGEVVVSAWNRDEVGIEANLGDEVKDFRISETSGGIDITVINNDTMFGIDGTDIELMVPRGASLEIRAVSADITIEGVSGALIQLESVSGDMELWSESPRVEIQTVSGDVEFTGTATRSSVESVSGDITVTGVGGEITVNTVSGEVSLSDSLLERGRFEAVSGDLGLDVALASSGRLTADNMSGDITLQLPDDQAMDISAQTFSGDISSDFGRAGSVAHGPGSVLEFATDGGGATIRLESFSGDIKVRGR